MGTTENISNGGPLTVFKSAWLMDILKDGEYLPRGLLEQLNNFPYILQVNKNHVFIQ